MSTQLGDIEIDSIEGTTVHGTFRSVYEKNVHTAHPSWAAGMLYDAFSSLHGVNRSESELLPHIRSVEFATPNAASTKFTVEVDDPAVLEGLEPGAWESYYLG
jgi:hypothetical protein